jgi:protein gp37
MAARFSGPNQPYEGLAFIDANGKSKWTGKIKAVPKMLDQPLRWHTPSLIFTNSMSDLFHEDVELNAIVNSFEVMEKANWHIYQTLTKRPELMPNILNSMTLESGRNLGKDPLPNVWVGASFENESTAAERSKWLAATPAVIRWISAEPLVGNIDWEKWIVESKADWVVFGGESRQGEADVCREMPIAWLRDGLAACNKLGVAAFVKQLGYWTTKSTLRPEKFKADPSGKKPDCWPEDIRIQDYPVDIKAILASNASLKKGAKVIPLEVLQTMA